MPVAETMTFTADLAARLATDPWRYLERLRDPNSREWQMIDPSTRIDRYAGSSRSVVSEAGSLLLKANDQISDGTFDSAQCAKSAQQLANLALTTGLKMVPR